MQCSLPRRVPAQGSCSAPAPPLRCAAACPRAPGVRRAAPTRFSAARASSSSTSSSDSARSNLTVIPGDYRLGGTLLGVSLFLGPVCHLGTQCLVHGLLGAFLSLQASRVRFRFSDQQLDVVFVQPGASDDAAKQADTASSGDNKLQGGGANAWSLQAITNWEFWWPGFPVLVYYKETQTRPEGQPHFFPIIMDGKKLYAEMLSRMPPSLNAKPPVEDWCLDTALEATPVGRAIKTKLEPDQLAALKGIKGLPLVDK